MNGYDIVFDVSRDLNDQVQDYEYLRWPQDQLISYFKEGYSSVVRIYKRDFIKQVVVELQIGNVWQTACDCTHILTVLGESDADGNIIKELTEIDNDSLYFWQGEKLSEHCPNYERTELTGFAINTTTDTLFKIFPSIVPGYDKRYVTLVCYKEPNVGDLDEEVPDKLIACIKQWMLYRALIIDSENNPAIAEIAKTHYQVYQQLRAALIQEANEDEGKEKLHGNRAIRAVPNGGTQQVSP